MSIWWRGLKESVEIGQMPFGQAARVQVQTGSRPEAVPLQIYAGRAQL